MKKIYYKFTCLLALSVGLTMVGCHKDDNDDVTPSSNGTVNVNAVDTTLVEHTNDSLRPPAGDGSSKSFFGTDQQIYTAAEIGANKNLSANVAFGYYFHPDPTYAATISNIGWYTVQYADSGWTNANTVFKVVPANSYSSITNYTQLKSLYDAGTVNSPDGAVYKLTPGQEIAYKTEQDRYGLIQIVSIIPDNDPSIGKIVFNVKMQSK
jgi:hypothetical protein